MRRTIEAFIAAGVLISLLAFGGGTVSAATEHCDSGGTKIESVVDGDLDNIVLAAGTEACVKGSTDAVSFTADGQTSLVDYLDNGHNVSYYVTYGGATSTPTPSASATPEPTESPSPTDSPQPTATPSPTPSEEPSATPSPSLGTTPPSQTPTEKPPVRSSDLPETSTVAYESPWGNSLWEAFQLALVVIFVVAFLWKFGGDGTEQRR